MSIGKEQDHHTDVLVFLSTLQQADGIYGIILTMISITLQKLNTNISNMYKKDLFLALTSQ